MIDYRLTPWDSKSFGFNTAELSFLKGTVQYSEFQEEFLSVEKKLKDLGIEFIYTRIDSNDFHMRKLLQKAGFYFAECSLIISRAKVQEFEKIRAPRISFVKFDESYVEQIRMLVRDSFNFSRFHEDPNISEKGSRQRYYNWIDDLIKEKATMHVAKVGEKIVGINIQKESFENLQAELILAGCSNGNQLYALSVWNEILSYNKEIGIRKIKTLISASNIGVVNIYFHFNFKLDKTLFGFHKRLTKAGSQYEERLASGKY